MLNWIKVWFVGIFTPVFIVLPVTSRHPHLRTSTFLSLPPPFLSVFHPSRVKCKRRKQRIILIVQRASSSRLPQVSSSPHFVNDSSITKSLVHVSIHHFISIHSISHLSVPLFWSTLFSPPFFYSRLFPVLFSPHRPYRSLLFISVLSFTVIPAIFSILI